MQAASIGSTCTGITTLNPAVASAAGFGDYIEIAALQGPPFSSSTVAGITRLCGSIFNAATTAGDYQATACSYSTPFKISVHFDADEAIGAPPIANTEYNHADNSPLTVSASPSPVTGSGAGYQGFWLSYWQTSC